MDTKPEHKATEETHITGRYCVYHQFSESSNWQRTWTGERFDMDDEEAKRLATNNAHKALDRSWPNDFHGTRLILHTHTTIVKREIIPAMWER